MMCERRLLRELCQQRPAENSPDSGKAELALGRKLKRPVGLPPMLPVNNNDEADMSAEVLETLTTPKHLSYSAHRSVLP